MTPAARIQAAIEVLDRIIGGAAAEQALTSWARHARYAGSGDRAAVRDHVFEALRRMRSDAALGGARSGRGLMLGALRRCDQDPGNIFTGQRHAPQALTLAETTAGSAPEAPPECFDMPDWLWPRLVEGLGEDAARSFAQASQSRAPVHLRVNLGRATRDDAGRRLAAEGIETRPHPAAETALTVTAGARRVRLSAAYENGIVELQDAASQAVVQAMPLCDGMRILDYCAGGGGKALAIAARAKVDVYAHDIDAKRMADLPARAARAGARIKILAPGSVDEAAPWDLVFCDVPCSGSGTWRRSPEGKWRLEPAGLDALLQTQADILDRAAGLVSDAGGLVYATCSVLKEENEDQVARFLNSVPGWHCAFSRRWDMQEGTDGFFGTLLTRSRET